jgi:hypothetical protein
MDGGERGYFTCSRAEREYATTMRTEHERAAKEHEMRPKRHDTRTALVRRSQLDVLAKQVLSAAWPPFNESDLERRDTARRCRQTVLLRVWLRHWP